MTEQHPITPPPKLVQEWINEGLPLDYEGDIYDFIAERAAQWGADQELDACRVLLQQKGVPAWSLLRLHRRPTPQILKEPCTGLPQLERVAQWDVVGNGSLVIHFDERRRIPNRWVRFWTRVFFTSKWQLPEDN